MIIGWVIVTKSDKKRIKREGSGWVLEQKNFEYFDSKKRERERVSIVYSFVP